MISRVADHCFWFGRYLERIESTARVLQVTRNRAMDAELSVHQCWWPIIVTAGETEAFRAHHGEAAAEDGDLVEEYLTWHEANLSSLIRSVGAARENARSIREAVSLETWEAVNQLHLWLHSPQAREEYDERRWDFYKHLRDGARLCLGLCDSTMLHDTPLDFIHLGALLERASQTARLLDVHHHALPAVGTLVVVETALMLSLLRACSGYEPFMKRHRGKVTGEKVAWFLIFEPRFPRSVRHCTVAARERLGRIRDPHDHELPGAKPLEHLLALDAWIAAREQERLDAAAIHDLLTEVVDETHQICDEIGRDLLGYTPAG
jgi:uncharacterized alpha-E superfamily protein